MRINTKTKRQAIQDRKKSYIFWLVTSLPLSLKGKAVGTVQKRVKKIETWG